MKRSQVTIILVTDWRWLSRSSTFLLPVNIVSAVKPGFGLVLLFLLIEEQHSVWHRIWCVWKYCRAFIIALTRRRLPGRCSNSWQAADKQTIDFEAMIFNLNNGAAFDWAAGFILTSRYKVGRTERSGWNVLFLRPLTAVQGFCFFKGREETGRVRWPPLKVTHGHKLHFDRVSCSSLSPWGESLVQSPLFSDCMSEKLKPENVWTWVGI